MERDGGAEGRRPAGGARGLTGLGVAGRTGYAPGQSRERIGRDDELSAMTTDAITQRDSPEVRATVLEFCRRMLAGEADEANDLISRDPATLMIGSAGEWVQDQQALRSGKLPDGEGLEPGPSAVAYEIGDAGWFADQPTWHFADGTSAQMRMTAVLAREAAGWRIVHAHLSVAVPDDECVMLQRRWQFGIPAPQ